MKAGNLNGFLTACMLFALVQVSFAQIADARSALVKEENWVLLDSHVVDYTLGSDFVNVRDSINAFTGLKFRVANGPINLHRCTVHFSNGETHDTTFTMDANDGHLVDLSDNNRGIERITFWYDTINSVDKRAVVEIWGKD